MPRTRSRRGFSLIELLIVVAILAILAGAVVPLIQDYLAESHVAKIQRDLEVLEGAIARYQEQTRQRLQGHSLGPLLGATLQELPRDPWNNEYLVDANLGILGTLGADATLGGSGSDADLLSRYQAPLMPLRCELEGSFGPPRVGARVRLVTSKSFGILPGLEDQVAHDVVLLRDHGAEPMLTLGSLGFTVDWGETDPAQGLLVLVCTDPAANPSRVPIRQADLVNFSPMVLSFTEVPSQEGPFADAPGDWVEGPQPAGPDFTGLPIRRVLGS